jgi:endoglucanase
MKRPPLLALVFLLLFRPDARPQPQPEALKGGAQPWWKAGFREWPKPNPLAKKLPLIRVSGNRFVNAAGDTILFRGLSISDPDKLEAQGHWNRAHFEKVRDLGALLVRIPVHPVAWRGRTPAKYLALLDQAVDWCAELGMYVDIDWHSIGNLRMELFQNPMYETTKKETFDFWRAIARHFKGNNTVAFYELFNEPTLWSGQLGSMTWSEWKKLNEEMIGLIRAVDDETIPLVAGLDWAYDLTPILIEPVAAERIGYVTHPYANKRPRPWEPKWEENFGFAAARYPILATEFGFMTEKGKPVAKDDYANCIIRYLEGKGIGWLAWVYDADWGPKMLQSWDTYELTGFGEFIRQAMRPKKDGP